MSKSTYFLVSGAIFLVIAAVHGLRMLFKWEVVVGGWQAPLWVSAVGFVFAAYLTFEGFRLSRSS
jgi:hypothetical protein